MALITGGSRGLGVLLARELAAEGCKIAICARDAAELYRTRLNLENRGAEVFALPCDVTQRNQVEETIAATVRRFGRLDILVNNAGIIQVGPVETMNVVDFQHAMAVNFWGTVYASLAASEVMKNQGIAAASSTSPRSAARWRCPTCCLTTARSSRRWGSARGCGPSWPASGSA